jgi:ATP-binding cassette subfamily B protein
MQKTTKTTFLYFFKKFKNYKVLTAITVIAIIIAVFSTMSWAIIFRDFINQLSLELPRAEIAKGLFATLFLIMFVEIIELIGWRVSAYVNNYIQPRIMADIMNECFDFLQNQSYRFFSNNFTGALVKKVNRLASSFQVIIDKILWDILPLVLKIGIIITVLTYLHPTLGIALSIWCVVFMILNYLFSIYKLKFDYERSKSDSLVTGQLSDAITNATTIKLFANKKFENKQFQKTTHQWFKKWKKSWDITSHIEGFQTVLMIILEFVIIYNAINLWVAGKIQVGDFFIIQVYLLEAMQILWNFGRVIRDIYERLADAAEMTTILQEPTEIIDKENAKKLKIKSGKIEFNNVGFSYNKNRKVIENLSFKIKPSEKVAIIGPSGGGKSTIIKLILRLFEIKSGQILIDDKCIQDITQDSLRSQITLVPQDPILFHRTLFENIRYGNLKATKKEVEAAAKLAYCHEFIQNFPQKYNTLVGERGIKLSGGERQRIAIARAILTNAPILILDEATSSLDSESEHLIQKALQNLLKNKTAIIIAHRLSTIQNVDRILVIKNGKIIEQGSHAEIVNKQGGTYKKLWNLQVGGYLK